MIPLFNKRLKLIFNKKLKGILHKNLLSNKKPKLTINKKLQEILHKKGFLWREATIYRKVNLPFNKNYSFDQVNQKIIYHEYFIR